jgi:diacylglycerol kinase family enzyme
MPAPRVRIPGKPTPARNSAALLHLKRVDRVLYAAALVHREQVRDFSSAEKRYGNQKLFAALAGSVTGQHEGDAEALTITCPLVSSALDEDRQVFEAAVIDVNHAGEVLGLLTAAALGAWRDAAQVAIVRTTSVTVSAAAAIPIIVDGETIEVGKEAHIEFLPNAFTVLVPPDEVLS